MISVNIHNASHLHGVKATNAHTVAFGHGGTEQEFGLLVADFTCKIEFGLGHGKHGAGNAERIVAIQSHFLLDLVHRLGAFRQLERHSLFLELGKRFQAFRPDRQREEFRAGRFGLLLDLRQVLTGDAHIFEQAGAFRHQGVHLFLAFLVAFVKQFALLVGSFPVLPAGSNCHVALLAGFFEVSLRTVQFGTFLDRVNIVFLLRKRNGGSSKHSQHNRSNCSKFHFGEFHLLALLRNGDRDGDKARSGLAFSHLHHVLESRSHGKVFRNIVPDKTAVRSPL